MTTIHKNPQRREIAATLAIDATPERVYAVSTEPEQIRRWWSCERLTMPVCENDVRPGGRFRFVGREPNGAEHAFHGEYREVVPAERFIHTLVYEPFPDAEALVTLTFEPKDGGTLLTSLTTFPTDEAYAGAVASGMEFGMAEAYDRLGTIAESRELSISRVVDAPRAAIFRAWTDSDLLARWFAPAPVETAVKALDPRPGGAFRVTMRTPDGQEFPTDGVFLEVVPNERIVFTDAFTEGWHPSKKPFMTAIVTLEDAPGGTLYTARARHASTEDRARHEAMGFHAGWNRALDQLESLVSGVAA